MANDLFDFPEGRFSLHVLRLPKTKNELVVTIQPRGLKVALSTYTIIYSMFFFTMQVKIFFVYMLASVKSARCKHFFLFIEFVAYPPKTLVLVNVIRTFRASPQSIFEKFHSSFLIISMAVIQNQRMLLKRAN